MDDSLCQLCNKTSFKYVCPRCNVTYCSVTCYQSPPHRNCSEAFYKESIEEWMRAEGPNPESKKKMMDILKRVEAQDLEDLDSNEEPDSDDELSLTDRLGQVDLDDADELWDRLLPEEKQEFIDLVIGGDVTKLIPQWKPWWMDKYPQAKVRFVDDDSKPEYVNTCPPLKSVPSLASLTKAEPSAQVFYNLVNVLAGYTITARYLNGDLKDLTSEAATSIVHISKNLYSNDIFSDFEEAIQSAHLSLTACPWIVLESDSHRPDQLKQDVNCILEGPRKEDRLYYVKAALSDCVRVMVTARKSLKKSGGGDFSKAFPDKTNESLPSVSKELLAKCSKKLEFYLSWTDAFLEKYL